MRGKAHRGNVYSQKERKAHEFIPIRGIWVQISTWLEEWISDFNPARGMNLDSDLWSDEFKTSTRKSSQSFTKPLSREHPNEATTWVLTLDTENVSCVLPGGCFDVMRRRYFYSGAVLRRGLEALVHQIPTAKRCFKDKLIAGGNGGSGIRRGVIEIGWPLRST